jgi:hypothetical protein
MDAGGEAQSTTWSKQMRLPGRNSQRIVVALLMATLLGPMGGGLAGYQMGMGTHDGTDGHHTPMAVEAAHDQMDGNDCAEHGSSEPCRRAGIWSTACCDYFSPGAKIRLEPSLESSSRASNALPGGTTAEVLEPTAAWGHLILPIAGEGRAGPASLVILHSSLRL